MENKNIKLSVVVPCYNEGENLPLIFESFKQVINEREDIEVIFVNNGSKDNSKNIFLNYLNNNEFNFFKVVEVDVNQGYGFGILSGLKKATGEVMAWTHADMQTDPKDVIKAFDEYKNYSNEDIFIKGRRKNRRIAERFFTYGMQLISSFALKEKLEDVNAQPKLFSRKFYNNYMKQAPYDFSLDLYALYYAKRNCRVIEMPVYFNKRVHGEAKGGGSLKTRIKLIKRTFKYIFELKNSIANNQINN